VCYFISNREKDGDAVARLISQRRTKANRVDIEAHFIRMFDLALNLPLELFMRLLGWTLHFCIDSKTHVVLSFPSHFHMLNSLSLHLTSDGYECGGRARTWRASTFLPWFITTSTRRPHP
jgi:hypothetical protein